MARLLQRRHRHEGEEEGGEELWLVSYADMVTLLFGFFVILFSFSTLDEKKFDQMTQKMSEAFKSKDEKKTADSDVGVSTETRRLRALQMLVAMLNLGENVDDAVAKIERSYTEGKSMENAKSVLIDKAAVESHGLVKDVKITKQDDVQVIDLVLPNSSLFPSGSYHLTPQAITQLQALTVNLKHVPMLTEIEVAGHTDSQRPHPGAGYDGNLALSSLRAGAVAEALIRFGIDKEKVTVRGMGDLKPLVPEYDEAGRPILENMARNRRVNIVLKVRRSNGEVAH